MSRGEIPLKSQEGEVWKFVPLPTGPEISAAMHATPAVGRCQVCGNECEIPDTKKGTDFSCRVCGEESDTAP